MRWNFGKTGKEKLFEMIIILNILTPSTRLEGVSNVPISSPLNQAQGITDFDTITISVKCVTLLDCLLNNVNSWFSKLTIYKIQHVYKKVL